ncbi:MAG TPA: DJ-1/PfpI/YhbO family deglycase/protease [Candidatus Methanoculleus thermohydrogenotrophicum]|jgi:protease I|nr:DJ-1/PfpI/YhbO family deglycase/protease [Candidatus Methanoculleus thermohydrogenotrophicum]HOB18694.1 DJ-1/PfpI/YhbO family deglycase/protease [Candidatus Methanoculleus thermohydrogenotrophicum]HPZ38764.1 DJ-1/PfpI/YhbO family deglycase/protease [Candidatus Methanoculleus thermohydrogenotrophicum]HQC91936.1 DJ-1/PfpI/YhbO family deglycase/protease [Candidatus Methanoculleus thermohydrogenotrophicum]
MNLLFAIAPEQFRDEELEIPRRIFKEAGIGVDIASTTPGMCTGMLGGAVEAIMSFNDVDPDDYAGIVVVGGIGSQDYLWVNKKLQALVRMFFEQGKVVAAICLAPVVLARAGILGGRQATVYPSPAAVREMKKAGANLVDVPVVADLQIVTANGPGAAAQFANTIITKLEC